MNVKTIPYFFLVFIQLGFSSINYQRWWIILWWLIFEKKAILILAGNLNSGFSYFITIVKQTKTKCLIESILTTLKEAGASKCKILGLKKKTDVWLFIGIQLFFLCVLISFFFQPIIKNHTHKTLSVIIKEMILPEFLQQLKKKKFHFARV